MSDLIQTINEIDLDLNKAALKEKGTLLAITQAETGMIDPLEHYAKVKQMQELLGAYLEGMKDYALTALEYEDESQAKRGHVILNKTSSGDRLDYVSDPIWKGIDTRRKAREEQLKIVFKGNILVDDSTGEVVPKIKVKTFGKTTIRATLK